MSSYRIDKLLGQGANGTVHLAYQQPLNRKVALKRLSPSTDPTAGRRFLREAQSLAALAHPNVVRVYEVGEEDGVPFLAMEYVEGHTLSELIRERSPRVLDQADELFAQLVDALVHVHGANIAHRDVKPGNIMLDAGGQLKLVDFGLVKSELDDTTALTEAGFVLGTVPYLAPEAFEGRFHGVPCDLWAAGCVYYELITGNRPFPAETTRALIHQITCEEPPPIADAGDKTQVRRAVLARLLAKNPNDRFADARAVRRALGPLLGESGRPSGAIPLPPKPKVSLAMQALPRQALPSRGVAIKLAALTALAVIGFLAVRPPPPSTAGPLEPVLEILRRHETARQEWEIEAGTIKPDLYSFEARRVEHGRDVCHRLVLQVKERLRELAPLMQKVPPEPTPACELMRATIAARKLMLELRVDRMEQTERVFEISLREKLDSLFGMGRLLSLDDQVQYDPALLKDVQEYFDISKKAVHAAARSPEACPTQIGLTMADLLFLGRQFNPYRFRGATQAEFQARAGAYLVALDDADTPAMPLGACAVKLFSLTLRGERLRDARAVEDVLSAIDRLAISLPAARAELDTVAGHVRALSSKL